MNPEFLLTAIIFAPSVGALILALLFDSKNAEAMRLFAFATTAVTFGLTLVLWLGEFQSDAPGMQLEVVKAWIPTWNVYYRLGVDGISMPLVLLTSLVSMLAMGASWSITKHIKGYMVLFLLLETGMMGVFLALDFFLFYVFWEVMLLPMYFLIGVWGGPRKEYAAIKFFLYTLAGSVLMLVAMLMFYFNSGVQADGFNLIKLAEAATTGTLLSPSMQITAFIMLFIGFAIKLPAFPVHTWLPDAHVEAPTPISMILAGVLLKMGGYGIIRIAFPLCPYGAQYLAYSMVAIGVISIIYGAFAALAQTDFKRLVAYSSVSHMGYVLLGLAVWKINEKTGETMNSEYWQMGLNGAMFQMIAHGISSAGMFFMVGVIYDRVHHRDLNKFGGLMGRMPLYGGLSAGLFFAGLGLPGLCGFIGEVFVVLSTWSFNPALAIVAASGVILTAGYILWAMQRVYLGAEYKGPHPEALTPMNMRETAIAGTLLTLAVILGVVPAIMFNVMTPSISRMAKAAEAGYLQSAGQLNQDEMQAQALLIRQSLRTVYPVLLPVSFKMLFPQLLDKLITETTSLSLPGFSVELCLSATIVAMLMMRLVNLDRIVPASVTAVLGAFAALVFTWLQFRQIGAPDAIVSQKIFTGLLIHDTFTVFFRAFLSLFLLLTIALTSLTGIPDNEDGPDSYSLLFGATIGLMIMASANSLLMLFVGVEMASVPSYAMVGFLKGRKPSSEAALKFVVYGAGAAGVMLYGISLIAGVLGTADMSLLAERLGEAAAGGSGGLSDPELRAVSLGILLVMVGLAFKLSLVPFHFWCPDAFEGASAEVAGFLSVASKAGAFGLLVRFALALSGAPGTESLMIAFGVGIGFIACVTTTFGNLAAYSQTNLKRLLAYSTIAHAGYMVMAVSALLVLTNSSNAAAMQLDINRSVEGLLYYLFVYLFMNLGAFSVVAIARNHTFSEEVDSFKGLVSQSPTLCIVMLICMFSLVGMPPFGGFVGKLMIFASAFKAGDIHWFMYVVVAFGALNTVFSLVYYIRVLKTMFMDARPADARPVPVPLGSLESIYVVALAAFVFLLGVLPQFLSATAGAAAQSLARF